MCLQVRIRWCAQKYQDKEMSIDSIVNVSNLFGLNVERVFKTIKEKVKNTINGRRCTILTHTSWSIYA